jgi:hypothetical protein
MTTNDDDTHQVLPFPAIRPSNRSNADWRTQLSELAHSYKDTTVARIVVHYTPSESSIDTVEFEFLPFVPVKSPGASLLAQTFKVIGELVDALRIDRTNEPLEYSGVLRCDLEAHILEIEQTTTTDLKF